MNKISYNLCWHANWLPGQGLAGTLLQERKLPKKQICLRDKTAPSCNLWTKLVKCAMLILFILQPSTKVCSAVIGAVSSASLHPPQSYSGQPFGLLAEGVDLLPKRSVIRTSWAARSATRPDISLVYSPDTVLAPRFAGRETYQDFFLKLHVFIPWLLFISFHHLQNVKSVNISSQRPQICH